MINISFLICFRNVGLQQPSPVGEGGPRRGSPKRACRVFGGLALAVDEEFYLSFVWLLLQQPPTAIAEWATAVRGAGEDFGRSHGAGGHSNNGSTAHPTPPEIPLRLRRALSCKPESSTTLRMTRAATHKTFTALHKKRRHFVCAS